MKINQLLGIAILALTLNACQQSSPQKEKTAIFTDSLSMGQNYKAHLIHMDSANKMITSYLNSIKDNEGELYALIMDADVLRSYLNDSSIKNVKIMLAHTLDYINSGNEGIPAGYKSGAFTIIMAGYNSEGNYIFAHGNMILDRAKPCPSNCPVTGTSASNLLK